MTKYSHIENECIVDIVAASYRLLKTFECVYKGNKIQMILSENQRKSLEIPYCVFRVTVSGSLAEIVMYSYFLAVWVDELTGYFPREK